jgi:hypothetical protein
LKNEAENTPQVVSGIKAKSDYTNLLFGMDVSENYVVGQTAVNSKAASAMFLSNAISEAKDPEAVNGLLDKIEKNEAAQIQPANDSGAQQK